MYGNVSRSLLFGLAILAGALTPSCHLPPGQTTAGAAANVAADVCAAGAAATEALDILPDVVDVFRNGGSDHATTLDRIRAGTRGASAMACAVAKALAHFSRTPTSAAAGAPLSEHDAADVRAAERARAYLARMRGEAPPSPSAASSDGPPPVPPPDVAVASRGSTSLSAVTPGCSCSPTLLARYLPSCCSSRGIR